MIAETRCTLCGLCVQVCPCQAVKLGDQELVFTCPEDCSHISTGNGALDCCLPDDSCSVLSPRVDTAVHRGIDE